jgi:hypothetical protein
VTADLAQGDAAEGAAVLAGRADAVRRRPGVAGSVRDQHRAGSVLVSRAQVPGRPVRGAVEQAPVIAAGAGQQVLHPVRARVPGRPGHGPAVVIIQFHQQSVHHVPAGQAGLPPRETRAGPRQQVIEQHGVRGIVYAGRSGCCAIVRFHKLA